MPLARSHELLEFLTNLVQLTTCKLVCRSRGEFSDDVDVGSNNRRTITRVRRRSVPLYGQQRRNNDNELHVSDDSGSVTSLHREPPLHRSNMMVWRDHWQPTTAHRLPNADRNNNSNGGKITQQIIQQCIGPTFGL